MIKPLYRRNNRAAVTANPHSAPISRNRSVKTVKWKIESVIKWHFHSASQNQEWIERRMRTITQGIMVINICFVL